MNQAYNALRLLLQELGVKVPNSVIRHLLDTPVGNTMRGISDALDSLNIENDVYQLPVEYLNELEYPYLMALPHRREGFALITNDSERKKILPYWEGILLKAQKTNSTQIFRYVWFKNVLDAFWRTQLLFLLSSLVLGFVFLGKYDWNELCHALLSLLGVLVSIFLMKKEYSDAPIDNRYCKIGKLIDCEEVLNSKGSHLFGALRLSDMSLLFFLTQLFLILQPEYNSLNYELYLALVGCFFTVFSVIYQIAIIRKICLYCLIVCLLIWMDTAILTLSKPAMVISNPYKLLFSGLMALIAWQLISRNTRLSNRISSARKRLVFFYKKEIFEWLLNQERTIEYLDDKFTEVRSTNGSDVITLFVNPKCKYCKKVLETIPKLTAHFKLRIVSIASDNSEIIEYCRRNQISKMPTIAFNNKILPEIFQVEDLEYVI